MTPFTFLLAAIALVSAVHTLHQLTRRTPPDLDLPDTWKPHPRTVVALDPVEDDRPW